MDLELRGGQIHALCGENGAGKSTLIPILGGVFRPDSGRIEIGGKPVRFGDPAAALAEGIGIIHQELNLVEPSPSPRTWRWGTSQGSAPGSTGERSTDGREGCLKTFSSISTPGLWLAA